MFTPDAIDRLVKLIANVGVPAVIALGFTYAALTNQREENAAMRTEHREIAHYARALCLNAAEDELEIQRCAPPIIGTTGER